ncbi:hypothetical protein GBF38_016000 [Nibea albiflora]|uniref:Uncharacterized protein n=1 Tax=Nibea albiflora TaxID=240163 RepID=A0ACB7FIF6_NIBAL|nr:hypothetical protein GBF38_016000 [Nibea albiflora]
MTVPSSAGAFLCSVFSPYLDGWCAVQGEEVRQRLAAVLALCTETTGSRISAVTENAAVLIHFGRFLLIKAVLASALFAAANAATAEASAVQSARDADKRHCGLSHHFVSVLSPPPPSPPPPPLTRDFGSLYLH